MNNKNWYDEVKEDFIKNINDSYTLNLAISVLEDRKESLNENLKLKEQLQQKEDIINKANNYVIDNANIYLNIYGEKIGFFKENDGKTPIELLKILDNKGE